MGLLPSSMHRCLCCHQAGIVALAVMGLTLLMCRYHCSPGVFAIIAIALLPLLQLHHCHCQAGVVALVLMMLLPSLMRRHLCHCHNGIVVLIALAPLSTLHRSCPPCCTGIIVLIALTSFPSHCMGVATIITPALLHPSSWCVCAVVLVLLHWLYWHCFPWCTGISTLVAQASLPLLCLHPGVNFQATLPLLSWHVLSRGRRGRPRRRQRQHQRNKSNYASTTRAATPVQ